VSARGAAPANKSKEIEKKMLRVTLLGNLGGEPEVRFTQKGTQFAQFSVAVNQVRLGPDRERQENTEWFRVRVSGRQSDFAQRLTKGSRVLVMGRLDISHYQGKDGEPRVGYDVWADDVQAMSTGNRPYAAEVDGSGGDGDEAAEPALAGASSLNGAPAAQNGRGRAARGEAPARSSNGSSEDLEDLPF
jgi:single-strand DNA-binding protein